MFSSLKRVYRTLRDMRTIFCRDSYVDMYLSSRLARRFPLAHYLLFGERRGYMPNPFFDPAYFAERSGIGSLYAYLSRPDLWQFATSERFDPGFYSRRARLPATLNPLKDFWTRGFDKRVDPSPFFDMAFFRDAVCRWQWDDRRYAFSRLATRDLGRPLSLDPAALRRSQDAFRCGIEIECLRRDEKRFDCLVFVQAGRDFSAPYVAQRGRYDVLLNFYERPADSSWTDASVYCQNGTKVTAIAKLFEVDPQILLRYDYVLFLDDDVGIDATAIDALFRVAREQSLDLAQAALTPDSQCYFPCLKRAAAESKVVVLTAVEIMMPVVSRRALEHFRWVFCEGVSGWAIDMLLGKLVRDAFGDRSVGLICDAVARHDRPVDLDEGRFYRFLAAKGIDPATEAGSLIRRFGAKDTICCQACDDAGGYRDACLSR